MPFCNLDCSLFALGILKNQRGQDLWICYGLSARSVKVKGNMGLEERRVTP